MPEIPLYTGGSTPRGNANFAPRMEGNLLTGLGDVLQDSARNGLGAELQAQKDQRDKLWALNRLADWKIQWAGDLKKRDEEIDDPEGFTPRVMEDYDVGLDAAMDEAPSDGARQFLAAKMGEYRVDVYNDALRIETGKGVALKSKAMQEVVQKAANFAMTSPKNGPDAIQMGVSAVRSSGLPSELRPEAERTAINQIGRSWVEGMSKDRGVGPHKTLERLRNGDFDNILSIPDRRVLENSLEVDIKQGEAQSKEEANRTKQRWARAFEDFKPWVADGNQPTAEDIERYSDANIEAMFADDPEAVKALKKERDIAFEAGKITQEPGTTLPELRAKAAEIRKKAAKDPVAYREADQRAGQVEAVVNRRASALAEDGGGFVQDDPVIQSVSDQIDELNRERDTITDPKEMEIINRQLNALYDEWATRTYQAQLKNGSPVARLPKVMVQTTVERINNAKPGEIPGIMAELRERFPSNWHRVAGEIQSKLQTKTRALFLLPPTKTTKLLADSHAMSTDDLLQGISDNNKDTLMDLFKGDRALGDFTRAIAPMQYGMENGEAFRDATLRGAAIYMKTEGLSAQEAWRKAREDNLSEYVTAYTDDKPFLVPRDKVGTPQQQEQLEIGTYHAKKNFKITPNTWLPPGLPGIVGKNITEDIYQSYIRRSGYFVMMGDNTGLALYANGNPVHAIVNGQKKYVVYTWDDLVKTGRFNQERRNREYSPLGIPIRPAPFKDDILGGTIRSSE